MICALCPASAETPDAKVVKHRISEHERRRRLVSACAQEAAGIGYSLTLFGGAGNG